MEAKDIIIIYREKNSKGDAVNVTTVTYTNNGKLVDSKGNVYKGDNKFINDTKKQLDGTRGKDAKTEKVISDMTKAGSNHYISNIDKNKETDKVSGSYTRNADGGSGNDSFTKLDIATDQATSKDRTSEEIVGHEMKHGYNIKHGMHDYLLSKSYNGITASEIDATNFQNIIRQADGNPLLTTYGGRDISKKLVSPDSYNNFKE